MDKDIEKFLEADNENEYESEDIKTYTTNKKKALSSIIAAVFVIFVFVITASTGIKLQNYRNNNPTSEISASLKEDDQTTLPQLSNKYKIKSVSFPDSDSKHKRGLFNINKDDIKALSDTELKEMFEYISDLDKYIWITINFADGTGIITYPGNTSTYLYGFLNDYGQISYLTGTIIKDDNGDFNFFVNSKNSQDETTDKNLSTETESKFQPASDTDTESVKENTAISSADDSDNESVYITSSGTKYHRAGCSYLSKSKISISLTKAKQQGYSPCSRCNK